MRTGQGSNPIRDSATATVFVALLELVGLPSSALGPKFQNKENRETVLS